jgi:hypothetical protein
MLPLLTLPVCHCCICIQAPAGSPLLQALPPLPYSSGAATHPTWGGGGLCFLRAPSRVLYFFPCNQSSSFVSASLLPLASGVCFPAGGLYPGCSEHSYCCMFTVSTLSVASFVPSVQQWRLGCAVVPSSIVGLSGMRVVVRLGAPVWSKHSYLCSSIGQMSPCFHPLLYLCNLGA